MKKNNGLRITPEWAIKEQIEDEIKEEYDAVIARGKGNWSYDEIDDYNYSWVAYVYSDDFGYAEVTGTGQVSDDETGYAEANDIKYDSAEIKKNRAYLSGPELRQEIDRTESEYNKYVDIVESYKSELEDTGHVSDRIAFSQAQQRLITLSEELDILESALNASFDSAEIKKPIRRLNMKKFVVNGNGFDWVEKQSFQTRKDAWKGRRLNKKDESEGLFYFNGGFIDVTLEPDGTYSYYIKIEDEDLFGASIGSHSKSNQSGYQLLKDLHSQNIDSNEVEKIRRKIQKMERNDAWTGRKKRLNLDLNEANQLKDDIRELARQREEYKEKLKQVESEILETNAILELVT